MRATSAKMGLRRRGMYFATLDTATSMPSLASSLRIRGAPQVTFAWAIRLMRLTTSRSSPGRPGLRAWLRRVQNRLNASRCQRTTVAGWTIARASRQLVQPLDRTTQKARSHGPSRRRRLPKERVSTATC